MAEQDWADFLVRDYVLSEEGKQELATLLRCVARDARHEALADASKACVLSVSDVEVLAAEDPMLCRPAVVSTCQAIQLRIRALAKQEPKR